MLPAPASGKLRARIAVLAGVGLLALLAVLVLVLSISRSESPSADGQRQADSSAPLVARSKGRAPERRSPQPMSSRRPLTQEPPGAPETASRAGLPHRAAKATERYGAALNDQGKALIDQGRPGGSVPVSNARSQPSPRGRKTT